MAVAFARVLRRAGLNAPVDSVVSFVESLHRLGIGNRNAVYWAARATLVRRPEDFATFDRAFAVFWDSRTANTADPEMETIRIALATDDGEDAGTDGNAGMSEADITLTLRFSAVESLREKDFANYSDDELVLARELMSRLRLAGPRRKSLRLRSAHGTHAVPDLRRTVRASLRSGGEPLRRYWKQPDDKLRRLVLLLDISGSMEPYSRAFMRRWPGANASKHSLSVRVSRASPKSSPRGIPTKQFRAPHDRSPIGAVARGWVNACAHSTTIGACVAWRAVRSSSSCPTDGIAVTRHSSANKCNVSTAPHTAPSG